MNILTNYKNEKTDEIALENIEKSSYERLVICLKIVKELQLVSSVAERDAIFKSYTSSNFLNRGTKEEKESDLCSHLMLKLCCAKDENKTKRFIDFEVELFSYRSRMLTSEELTEYIVKYHSDIAMVPYELKRLYKKELFDVFNSYNYNKKRASEHKGNTVEQIFDKTRYYKLPFQHVLSLVKNREVFLKYGEAFVPEQFIIVYLTKQFRTQLEKSMASIQHIPLDERLVYCNKHLEIKYEQHIFNDIINTKGVTLNKIEESINYALPLCMKNVYEHTKKKHYLKYHGRVQLQFFMKSIGITLHDCSEFLRTNFKMDDDEFDKQYAYNIKACYSDKKSYLPWSCNKILHLPTPSNEQVHGCPFKENENVLTTLVLPGDKEKEIKELVKNKEYQRACKCLFTYKNPTKNNKDVGNHPHTYFLNSINN